MGFLLKSVVGKGKKEREEKRKEEEGYTATLVACRWAGAVMEEVTGTFGQER